MERIDYILNKLDETGFLNVNNLANELNVSSATIRRDFTELEQQGKLKRVPGGAIKTTDNNILSIDSDLAMNLKVLLHHTEKKLVCELACSKVHDGDCIFIDAGTSSIDMFKLLQDRYVTIVTNNIMFASQITPPIRARIIIIGGLYMADYALTYSASEYDQIQNYNFNHCFITCAGVDIENGEAYCTETETRNLKRLIIKKSKFKHLLIDSSKIDTLGFCTLDSLNSFDTIFCDKKKEGTEDIEYPSNFQFAQ